jgi:hypothetical protein
MRTCFPDLNPVVCYLTAKLRTEISRPFSMEIVMLVSWAIWTPRNDFIIKGYWIMHKSELSSEVENNNNKKEFVVLNFNYYFYILITQVINSIILSCYGAAAQPYFLDPQAPPPGHPLPPSGA